jgi:HEAT repeat protein
VSRDELTAAQRDPASQLANPDAAVRRIAVAATSNHPELHRAIVTLLAEDPSPTVRRECAEILGRSELSPVEAITAACADPSPEVREAAVTALGEIASPDSVPLLLTMARDGDEDKLVREAGVAALGAIGDTRAVPTLLELIASASPQIRRRCVPALSVFDGDEVEAALRQAARDRNPMVREAAEMVVGRTPN